MERRSTEPDNGPLPKQGTLRIAVKFTDHLGDEAMECIPDTTTGGADEALPIRADGALAGCQASGR